MKWADSILVMISLAFCLTSCNSHKYLDKVANNNATQEYQEFLSKSVINVPIYPLTKGPKHHWFAYYDKYQTDPRDRYVLSMEVDFEKRSPGPEDYIKIGMVDLKRGGAWIELDSTRAWNWQQGCMLQWRPGSEDEIMWNDRQNGRFVCHILNVKTRQKRTIPTAIYDVSPDGTFAMTLDFERVQDMRAGYGYTGLKDSNTKDMAPDNAGIYRVSLDSGKKELFMTIRDIAEIPNPVGDLSSKKHYFNHIDVSPDGKRFIFLHRWKDPGKKSTGGFEGTRFLTASVDGENVHVINDSPMTSHFWWKSPTQIIAWANRPEEGNHYYLFDDSAVRNYKILGEGILKVDGHMSYLDGSDWIISDTYPDKNRQIELFLFNTVTNDKIVLGKFYSPEGYKGEHRIDLHPRQTRDEKKIIIDCPIGPGGRQLLMLDIDDLELN